MPRVQILLDAGRPAWSSEAEGLIMALQGHSQLDNRTNYFYFQYFGARRRIHAAPPMIGPTLVLRGRPYPKPPKKGSQTSQRGSR